MTLMSLLAGRPARTSQSPDFERELLAIEAFSPLSLFAFFTGWGQPGSASKMFPASSRLTAAEPSECSSPQPQDTQQDMFSNPPQEGGATAVSLNPMTKTPSASHGGCWTLNTTEFHKGAVASSLSDILETGDQLRRYYLTPRACAGILRRAEKRGKKLPEPLERALQQAADSAEISKQPADCK